MIAYVDVNKPEHLLSGDDKDTVAGLVQFFTTAGYFVIVRNQ
jgi:hypothetical protein